MQVDSKKGFFKDLDDAILNRPQNEQKIIYLFVALVIGYLIYQFVFPYTTQIRNSSYNKMKSMQNQVNSKRKYLRYNTQAKLRQMKTDIQKKHKLYNEILYKISYVDNTLSELSYLLFNNQNWARFVDNISYLAKKYNLEIKRITNKFYKPTFQKVSQVVTLKITTLSNYTSMMKFLNKLEETKLVVDVSDMNITKPKNKLSSSFKISVWGMEY